MCDRSCKHEFLAAQLSIGVWLKWARHKLPRGYVYAWGISIECSGFRDSNVWIWSFLFANWTKSSWRKWALKCNKYCTYNSQTSSVKQKQAFESLKHFPLRFQIPVTTGISNLRQATHFAGWVAYSRCVTSHWIHDVISLGTSGRSCLLTTPAVKTVTVLFVVNLYYTTWTGCNNIS